MSLRVIFDKKRSNRYNKSTDSFVTFMAGLPIPVLIDKDIN